MLIDRIPLKCLNACFFYSVDIVTKLNKIYLLYGFQKTITELSNYLCKDNKENTNSTEPVANDLENFVKVKQ